MTDDLQTENLTMSWTCINSICRRPTCFIWLLDFDVSRSESGDCERFNITLCGLFIQLFIAHKVWYRITFPILFFHRQAKNKISEWREENAEKMKICGGKLVNCVGKSERWKFNFPDTWMTPHRRRNWKFHLKIDLTHSIRFRKSFKNKHNFSISSHNFSSSFLKDLYIFGETWNYSLRHHVWDVNRKRSALRAGEHDVE